MADRKAASAKGGKNSTRKGVANKRSTEATNKMVDRKFDPLENAMDLATGKSKAYVHPYAKKHTAEVEKILEDVRLLAGTEGVDLNLVITKLEKLSADAIKQMSKNYVPVEVRAKMVTELLRYRYPKLKDIEISGALELNVPQLELVLKDK